MAKVAMYGNYGGGTYYSSRWSCGCLLTLLFSIEKLLPSAFHQLGQSRNDIKERLQKESLRLQMEDVLSFWESRNMFVPQFLEELRQAYGQ